MEVRYGVDEVSAVALGHRGKYSTYLGIKRPGYCRLERASIRFRYVCTFLFCSFSFPFSPTEARGYGSVGLSFGNRCVLLQTSAGTDPRASE